MKRKLCLRERYVTRVMVVDLGGGFARGVSSRARIRFNGIRLRGVQRNVQRQDLKTGTLQGLCDQAWLAGVIGGEEADGSIPHSFQVEGLPCFGGNRRRNGQYVPNVA